MLRSPGFRALSTHQAQIRVLESGIDAARTVTYPESDVIHSRIFYQDAVSDYAAKPATPVSLRQTALFGRNLTPSKLVQGANYLLREMSVRLAHRIWEMHQMPFRIMDNEHLTQVFEQYSRAFDKCRRFGIIRGYEQNDSFCDLLTELLDKHGQVLPDLILGVKEVVQTSARPEDSELLDQFMSKMLASRISRRFLAEQHLALSRVLNSGNTNKDTPKNYMGEVFSQCMPTELLSHAIDRVSRDLVAENPEAAIPKFEIEGDTSTSFLFWREHIDYMLIELLRNSAQAQISQRVDRPISVVLSSTSENIFFRISDQGGGIPGGNLRGLWSFSKPFSEDHRVFDAHRVARYLPEEARHKLEAQIKSTPLCGVNREEIDNASERDMKLGVGLAMSRVYAEYWDGALELHSLEGYGCDALLRIPHLATKASQLNIDRI